jgi:FKBP12-rapamycin complex-associated protein
LAIQTLGRLCKKLGFSEYASRLIHPLARILDNEADGDLRREAMETLCTLVYQLGSDYAIFIPMVNKILTKHRIQHSTYETLVSRLLKNQPLILDGAEFAEGPLGGGRSGKGPSENNPADMLAMTPTKLKMNEQKLRRAWEASQRSTKEDWVDWMRRFSVELLQQSPSPALRSCLSMAQVRLISFFFCLKLSS